MIVEGVALNCKANAHFIARKSVAFSCVFLSARLAQMRPKEPPLIFREILQDPVIYFLGPPE